MASFDHESIGSVVRDAPDAQAPSPPAAVPDLAVATAESPEAAGDLIATARTDKEIEEELNIIFKLQDEKRKQESPELKPWT